MELSFCSSFYCLTLFSAMFLPTSSFPLADRCHCFFSLSPPTYSWNATTYCSEVATWDAIPWSEKTRTTLGHNSESRPDGLRESKSINTVFVFLGCRDMFAFVCVRVVEIGRRRWDESGRREKKPLIRCHKKSKFSSRANSSPSLSKINFST